MTESVAFVTPSYRLDRDRCALLSRSLDACAPSFEHWIIVDRGDLPLFRPLQNHRTHVVAKEEVLPVRFCRLDTLRIGLRSNVWVQARGMPVRGWLLQQLIKLAIAEQLSAEVLVYADSDVVMLRPFSASTVADDGRGVRLFARPDEVDESLPDHVRWHRSAEKLLGIEPAELPMPGFISSLVPWKRDTAVALLDRIERTTERHWLGALTAAWHVSEYTLYGRYALDVLGADSEQFVSSAPLCRDYYTRAPLSVPDLEALLDHLGPEEIAISLTAKAGMRPAEYVEVLERRWAALGTEVAPAGSHHGPGPTTADAPSRQRVRAQRGVASRGMLSYRIAGAIALVIVLALILLELALD